MDNHFSFIGGRQGQWQVSEVRPIIDSSLELCDYLQIINGKTEPPPANSNWVLQAFTSNIRYSTRAEQNDLKLVQPPLDREEAISAVLIPIKKKSTWWELAQDERRAIFEEQSHHTAVGLEYLPRVARRLFHCRDLGEPFDLLSKSKRERAIVPFWNGYFRSY
jgi:hypothetical protein